MSGSGNGNGLVALLFTQHGYILQVAVTPEHERTLEADTFIPITRCITFLLLTGETRLSIIPVRGYYAITLSIGHLCGAILYGLKESKPSSEVVSKVLVRLQLTLSIIHHQSGAYILDSLDYLDHLAGLLEKQSGVHGIGTEPLTDKTEDRFYKCQSLYAKMAPHLNHNDLLYFRMMAKSLFLGQEGPLQYDENDLSEACLLFMSAVPSFGIAFIGLSSNTITRPSPSLILDIHGSSLNRVLSYDPELCKELCVLANISAQIGRENLSSGSDPTDSHELVHPSTFLCGPFQVVCQPIIPISSTYPDFRLCLITVLCDQISNDAPRAEQCTEFSTRLRYTPSNFHRPLHTLSFTIISPFLSFLETGLNKGSIEGRITPLLARPAVQTHTRRIVGSIILKSRRTPITDAIETEGDMTLEDLQHKEHKGKHSS
ncbi:hypothetical protein GMRT_10270 [Giardia muris]|uniref:Uncharacterized protein n=1 Tax=Giardia muris TaxID=5742 RepID=A0A4Z1T158_GIAMU|nr:hypothetical protein GMRT_10270 [Giardia muris]|eukprot:TNJ29438.1 hypothetical protein GMRT_10270 [Giardia muris]